MWNVVEIHAVAAGDIEQFLSGDALYLRSLFSRVADH